MKKNPVITVITIVFNNVLCIENTIKSVLSQTYKEIEYIVIDGASTDGTLTIIEKYSDSIKMVISEPDNGIYNAMNKGIRLATGDWILFINSGDSLFSIDSIENLVKTIIEETPDVLYGNVNFVYSEREERMESDDDLSSFKKYMPIFHPATLVKSDLLKDTLFDESYRVAADYKFFYNLYRSGAVFQKAKICVSNFEAEDGISNNNIILAMKENFKVRALEKKYIWVPKYCLYYLYMKLIKNK